jgi:hypothetical protein
VVDADSATSLFLRTIRQYCGDIKTIKAIEKKYLGLYSLFSRFFGGDGKKYEAIMTAERKI